MPDGQYLDDGGHAIDDDIVGRDQCFPRAGDAAGTIEIGMIG